MFFFTSRCNFFLGNTMLFSGIFFESLNLFGIVFGLPTSKKDIRETGHQFVELFKITLQERISDPFFSLISTILLIRFGRPFSSESRTTSPTAGVLEVTFLFLPILDSNCFASHSFNMSKYKQLKSFSIWHIDILSFLKASPNSF